MQAIQLRFVATANLAQAHKEVAQLQTQFAALQKQMATGFTGRGGKVDVAGYKAAEAQLSSLRTRYTEALRASGQFDVVQTKLLTNTQNLTNKLRSQKLTIRDVARQWSGLKDVYRQQMAMQKMQVAQWRTDPFGRVDADVIMPREVLDRPLKFRDNLRLMNAAISSSSTQLINWGKNTQWAGRQIMVGLTVPTAMFAAAAGSMAYAAENEMTRVMKVYDTTAQDMYGKEQELAQLRSDSYAMAGQAANLYGVAVKDTLNVEADLAQTGLQGAELKKSTTEVLRIATLGELDYQQALQMTIALQNAFKMDSEELTNTLNFMNSVENATSLSIQDIAEATPRAASAMASLNMTAEEMVILLTAMKERGVDATEGANALKSGITRALRPTSAAIERFAEHGIDIERIVQNAGGNLLEILRQIGQQAQDLDRFDLGQAMAELFGTYQFNRLNAALAGVTEGYGGVADASSQTAKAIAVSQQSISENAQAAQEELNRWQQSAPGKFKRALESVKAEIVQMGMPFLEVGAVVMGFVQKLLGWFNDLPSAVKKFAMIGVVAAGLVGPLVMMTGIFGNFIGTIGKGITSIMGLVARFKILDPQERAAALLAKQAALGFDAQANSALVLREQMSQLTAGMRDYNNELRRSQGLSPLPAPGRHAGYRPRHAPGVSAENTGYIPKHATQLAGDSERASRSWGSIAANVALVGGTLGMIVGGTNKWVSVLSQAALIGAMIGPNVLRGLNNKNSWASLWGVITATGVRIKDSIGGAFNSVRGRATSLAGNITGIATASRAGAAGIKGMAMAAGGLVTSFLRLVGPAGVLIAVGSAAFGVYNSIKKAREEQEKANNAAEDRASILGYTYQEVGSGVSVDPETGEQVKDVKALAAELSKANKPLAERLRLLKDSGDEQRFLNEVMQQGIDVYQTGGTIEQAHEAMRAALVAAGASVEESEEFMMKIDAQIDFDDIQSQIDQQAAIIGQKINDAVNNSVPGAEMGKGEQIVRWFTGDDDLTVAARESAQKAADSWWTTYMSLDEEKRKEHFNNLSKAVAESQTKAFNMVNSDLRSLMNEAHIQTPQQLLEVYKAITTFTEEQSDLVMKHPEAARALVGNMTDEMKDALELASQTEMTVAQRIASNENISGDKLDSIKTLKDLLPNLTMSEMSVAEATNNYAAALMAADYAGRELNEEERLAILNHFRNKAGLDNARVSTQGFKAASEDAAEGVKTLNEQINELTGLTDQDFIGGLKGAMDQTMNDAYAEADRIMAEQHQSELDAIAAAGEEKLEQLERDGEAKEAEFDARREAMDREFEAQNERHQAKWDKIMESFDNRWERASENLERKQEAEGRRFEARWEKKTEAVEKQQEKQSRILDAAHEKQDRQAEARWDREMKRHEKRWEQRREREEAAYDRRIEQIDTAIEKEKKAEETRQRIFEAEQRRIERMAATFNRQTQFNVALNTGDLDEAARIMNDQSADVERWTTEDAAEKSKTASEKRIEAMEKEIERIEEAKERRLEILDEIEAAEKEKLKARQEREKRAIELEQERDKRRLQARHERQDKALRKQREREQRYMRERHKLQQKELQNQRDIERKSLESQRQKEQKSLRMAQDRRRKDLENERKAFQKSLQESRKKAQTETRLAQESARKQHEAKRRALEIELRELKAFTPRNREELNAHMGKVRKAYDKYGIDLKAKGNSWSKYVGNRFTANLRVAGQDLKNKINWDNIGASIAAKLIGGSFGMRPREFAQWIVNGKVPKGGISGVTTGGAAGTRGRNQIARHTGGPVFDGRSGIPRSAGKYPSEVDIRAKVGEWVMPTNSVRKYGPDFMHSVQKGDYDPNAMGGPGAAMLMGAMSAGITQAAINAAIQTAAARAMMLGSDMIAGKPGKYGDTTFNAEQLQNASTIMSVGSQLGASSRDLVIALMTAMQESMLRNINYGHLDSLGLFQQRSAWGSAADRTNPAKATRMFFKGGKAGQPGLFDIKGRNKMSLSAAAQAVQRSAFPNAYAKWENEARAILASAKSVPGGGTGPSAGKGWNMPLPRGSYRKSMGFLGYPGHYGADYAAPSGTPIYAVKGGTVTVAKDLTTSYGKHVGISHPDGWYSLYAHMSRRRVGDGAKVRQGQRIGDVGTTGNSTGNHLHLETRMGGRRGRAYDPSSLIPGLRKGGQIRYDNTLANLHKNETVLTAPLTERFKDGISNLDSGGAVEYNVTVDLRGAVIRDEVDFQRGVEKALENIENRKGHKRRIGTK